MEICFKKIETTTWSTYGMITQTTREVSILETNLPNKYTVLNKQRVTHNTWLLELQRCDDARIVVPLGKHLRVFGKVGGKSSFFCIYIVFKCVSF